MGINPMGLVDATINLLAPYGAHVILMQLLLFIRNLYRDQ